MTGINNPATQHKNPKDLNPKHQCPQNPKITLMESFKLYMYPSGDTVSGATSVTTGYLTYTSTQKLPTYLVRAVTWMVMRLHKILCWCMIASSHSCN